MSAASDPNGPPIPSGSGRTIQTDPIRETTQFRYDVSNGCGTALGFVGVLPCDARPVISTQPADSTVVRGTVGRVAVVIPFGTFARFQWYEGRAGDTSHPLPAEPGILDAYVLRPADRTTTYWCRLTNACGTTDSTAATITVVDAMSIASVAVVGSGAKTKLVARGTSIPDDVQVFLPGVGCTKAAKVRGGTKVTQRGPLTDGRTIDAAIPRGSATTVTITGSRGSVTVEVTRP